MNVYGRSWVMWGAGLATIAAGAWMLQDDRPNTETSADAAGAAPQLPVSPPTTTAGPPASASAPAATADRFKLVGVMTLDGANVAMIAVDGQRARMFRVGDSLDGKLLVRALAADGAVIGPQEGGAEIALKSTPTPSPETSGSLPNRDLSDGSPESAMILLKRGAKNAPQKPPTAAEQASAAQASVPTDPGTWRPPGQP